MRSLTQCLVLTQASAFAANSAPPYNSFFRMRLWLYLGLSSPCPNFPSRCLDSVFLYLASLCLPDPSAPCTALRHLCLELTHPNSVMSGSCLLSFHQSSFSPKVRRHPTSHPNFNVQYEKMAVAFPTLARYWKCQRCSTTRAATDRAKVWLGPRGIRRQ